MNAWNAMNVRLDTDEIAALLQECRARTLLLVASLDDEDIRVQHSSLMSPIVWDLGHVAHFEEVWLLERTSWNGNAGAHGGGPGASDEGLRGIYNPFDNPRSTRSELTLPSRAEAFEYMATVRSRVLERLESGKPISATAEGDAEAGDALLSEDMVFHLVLQHEYQHNETILQTLQLKRGDAYDPPRALVPVEPPSEGGPSSAMVHFPGGEVAIGTDEWGRAYDNERPRHVMELPPFSIDATPVTGAQFQVFIEDGGYRRKELWSPEGWAWKEEEGAEAPAYWYRADDGWMVRVLDRHRPAADDRPVCHVCYFEAEAFSRWAGKRLPTEFEWEAAASWDPDGADTAGAPSARRFPWGGAPPLAHRANVDHLLFDTAPIWSYPENVSPLGCYGMIGDVWEWTSSDFRGYPGFRSFPYREYSEVFFGSDQKVLRGGSWATRSGAIRNTFRNWDYPIRRQIFSGFRCARDEG